MIGLTINGTVYQTDLEPSTTLAEYLRNHLGLTGTKIGCAKEQCFACAVLIDGVSVPSCTLPLEHLGQVEITTVEGLGGPDELNPLQEAFAEMQAAQCGFCTSGMLISAQGLLNRVRYPTNAEIKEGLASNLCRCGVYDRVRRAIKLTIGHIDVDHPFSYEMLSANLEHQPGPLSDSFKLNPSLDQWLAVKTEGVVELYSGKVEIGQGLKTTIAQLAAEELNLSLHQVRVVPANTAFSPQEGKTSGSRSTQTSGLAIQQAAAQARHTMLQIAHEHLEASVEPHQLDVVDGVITDPQSGKQTSYWEIQGDRPFGTSVAGQIRLKDPSSYTIIGSPAKRLDIYDK
ncbi:MAG: molybdopterin cofactor-binding domain-containing protein, partial [Chloroflexota bacterium]